MSAKCCASCSISSAPARAQRRDLDLDDADPVVEVLAELPLRDEALEILMRRAHDANVGAERLPPADALERALLEEAQELALHVVRQIADLVEEERAALRHLDLARARGDRRR